MNERMFEDVLQLGLKAFRPDKVELLQQLKAMVDLLSDLSDSLEDLIKESPSNNRGFSQNPP
jgi:hypothetical protein